MVTIERNVQNIMRELPEGVDLVAAVKSREIEEISKAITGGVRIIGENYVQEASSHFSGIGNVVKWHFIGRLQKNKVKKAVNIFDVIETIDSIELAREVDKRCRNIDKVMSVFIEINSGRESQKSGVYPEDAKRLAEEIFGMVNVKVTGLMTMGPYSGDPEDARPFFEETRRTFEDIKEFDINGVNIRYLSMGMTNSYKVALEEGANIIRIGEKIFGARE